MKNVIICLGETVLLVSGITIIAKATSRLYDKTITKLANKKAKRTENN